jgi:hypothetical protein
MKLVTALAVLLFLAAAGSADASWFGGRKLPKPIDSPRVRPKADDSYKVGKKQRHPQSWGSLAAPTDTARA